MKLDTDQTLAWLRAYEARNVTFMEPDGSWPIVWERARGVHVWDAAGKKYLDLTAAFGVAAAGHANLRVVKAGQSQMQKLLHAMGDVHPHWLKAQLARELSRLTFERWNATPARAQIANRKSQIANRKPPLALRSTGPLTGKTLFCNSGFEAVEAALKTALLATGKRGVIAFERAYHGLGYGALNATHRDHFRTPFLPQLGQFGCFVPYPTRPDQFQPVMAALRQIFAQHPIGAVLVEPIQGRGGIQIPVPGFLPHLRHLCDAQKALLIVDEIFTGFGRTGRWFACEHFQTVPDLVCLGKALTGGFPLSACVGQADWMDAAWPPATGEAIHTSTFLGHPVGCAMALAQIAEIDRQKLVERSERLGTELLALLADLPTPPSVHGTVRGLGLMAGLELTLPDGSPATTRAMRIVKDMLRRGFILLAEGEHGNVITLTPPLTISIAQVRQGVKTLGELLNESEGK